MELPEKRQLGCSVMSRFLRLESAPFGVGFPKGLLLQR